MNKITLKARALRAAEICGALGITQTEIAVALGSSQAQVSRILRGQNARASRLFEEVCLYAERKSVGVTVDAVRANEELVEALRVTWDGTGTHARALATVIRSLSVLANPVSRDQSTKETSA